MNTFSWTSNAAVAPYYFKRTLDPKWDINPLYPKQPGEKELPNLCLDYVGYGACNNVRL